MQVYTDFSRNYSEDPICYFDFRSNNKKKLNFYYGINNLKANTKKSKYNVFFDLEEPSSDINEYPGKYDENFNKILSICPYTCNFINKKFKSNRQFVFFPFNDFYTPKNYEKYYDIVYTGQMNGYELEKKLNILKNFKYALCSFTKNKLATHINLTYKEKLDLVSKSKISVIHNLVFPNTSHISNLKKNYDYKLNQAYSHIDLKIYPQQKSRMFEAAFCKTLMLVQRDPWNIIEQFFKPNVDFIYFNDEVDLYEIICDVLINFSNYKLIINNAFKKAQNYTTSKFYKKFLFKYDK
jgi:hypothetical protein